MSRSPPIATRASACRSSRPTGLTKTYRVFQKKDGLLGALRGLYRREYKEVKAVDGVSFSIEPGEMVAFLGPNGAGKTTTLKMLSGLIYPTSGTAEVLGFTPWQRADAFRRQFALVMGQKNQLWWDLPAADSFQLHREIYSLPEAEFNATLAELTELLGVEKLTRQAVRELSLGERMKMELIAALLHQPQLLLLDEPTIGLDVVAQVAIQKCLRDYHARRGRDDAPDQPLHARRRGPLLRGCWSSPTGRSSTTARSRGSPTGSARPSWSGSSSPTGTSPTTSTGSAR